MIPQVLLKLIIPKAVEQLAKMCKLDKMDNILKYVEQDNELDIKVRDLAQRTADNGFRMTAMVDMIKQQSETIDGLLGEIKKLKNIKGFKGFGK